MTNRNNILVRRRGYTTGAEAGAIVGKVASVLGLPSWQSVGRARSASTLSVKLTGAGNSECILVMLRQADGKTDDEGQEGQDSKAQEDEEHASVEPAILFVTGHQSIEFGPYYISVI